MDSSGIPGEGAYLADPQIPTADARASLSGLCHEGAWEARIDAIRQLDLERLVDLPEGTTPENSAGGPD